jgi:SagB-type dehydrogenase family enzyme
MSRARRAYALLLAWRGEDLVGIHYPTRRTAVLDAVDRLVLAACGGWVDADGLSRELAPEVGVEAYEASLHKLFDAHHLLHEDSDEERLDAAVRDRWPWGHQTAFYQLGIRDPGYLPSDHAAELLTWRLENQPQVPLTSGNDDADEVVPLPRSDLGDPLFRILSRRRSRRCFAPAPLSLESLARVLAAGLGITGFAVTSLTDRGMVRLPVKMAPSGGSRNPYEGYVVARSVAGLDPGAYHYAGVDHTLGRLPGTPPSIPDLLGGQEWFEDAAAVILLVARFERTAWKYTHPTGYRVVLMEAGHIGQNLLLAATAEGLAAAPTAAIHDRAVEGLLGLEPPLQSAVYAIALGRPGEGRSPADFPEIAPNPVFG